MSIGVEYKLPNEDEWYLACNNGKDSTWHFGDEEKELKDYAWYGENAQGKTHPVGLKKHNDFGLYDMHGNVWEWCEEKVVRGGSWFDDAYFTRSAFRDDWSPADRLNFRGFRILRTLP